jgi:ABC-2 type transport system permease protein
MPEWLQLVARASPLKYYLIIVRGTFLMGLPPAEIFANAWPMALIALVTLSLAIVVVRRNLQ